jgi:hypothetical protein
MKRAIVIVLGLLLLALSAAWFFSDLPGVAHEMLADRGLLGARSRSLAPGAGSWDTIKTALDVANAVIGCVGIYLAVRGSRQSQSMSR